MIPLSGAESYARIKVIGVGGGGSNAVTRMIRAEVRGIEFIAVNTDAQALMRCDADRKIHIGDKLTRGLGAGGDPQKGLKAAEETSDQIYDALKDSDMVFIAAGMGGGTGSGAAPVIAQIAQEMGALTVAVVTRPFTFEGQRRARIADEAILQLTSKVDTIIAISNDRISSIVDKKMPFDQALRVVDEVLQHGIQGIAEIITVPGLINVDFADVKSVMREAGSALLAIGRASGEQRAVEAARAAITSPLLESGIEGARGILFNITGGNDLALSEVTEAARTITDSADADANIIFGAVIDPNLDGEIRITAVATGFVPTAQTQGSLRASSSFLNGLSQQPLRPPPREQSPRTSPAGSASGGDADVPPFVRNPRAAFGGQEVGRVEASPAPPLRSGASAGSEMPPPPEFISRRRG
ncbi:MAG: cell division protein FtsZ [Chloroflexi bacterium]|nr:cell division protein FtsZ [Chloroflexota bacterium]